MALSESNSASITASRSDAIYRTHAYHTKVPPAVAAAYIEQMCPENGLVLDPFCGSGSTLVAARECGRDWLGIELDAAHHRTATARLRTTVPRF